MDVKDSIIKLMWARGPVLPVQVAKEIGSNILIASAHLSELSSNKKIKISSLKVGGSPLYYISGQEEKLQQFVDNLPVKEREAYSLLKKEKILRDDKLEPSIRVALRRIKDFAVPLQVNCKEGILVFWRWSLLTNEEAQKMIKSELNHGVVEKEEHIKQNEPEKKKEEVQKSLTEQKEKKEKRPENPVPEKKEPISDNFLEEIMSYFKKNNINVIEKKLVRKGSEYVFFIEVPSSIGKLPYFCVAKSKKRINHGDLSSTFINAQSEKLPAFFLTKGELTKRAKEMLKNEFKGMKVNKI